MFGTCLQLNVKRWQKSGDKRINKFYNINKRESHSLLSNRINKKQWSFVNNTIDVSFSSSVNDPKLLFDYAFKNICLKCESEQTNEQMNDFERMKRKTEIDIEAESKKMTMKSRPMYHVTKHG